MIAFILGAVTGAFVTVYLMGRGKYQNQGRDDYRPPREFP